MQVLIIGNLGNMGWRYSTVLNHIDVPWIGLDINGPKVPAEVVKECTHCIVATPTISHTTIIMTLMNSGHTHLKFLCEKPISKNLTEVEMLVNECKSRLVDLHMVNQYEFIPKTYKNDKPPTTQYNYFKTGGDGLAWDCINILGLSDKDVELSNDSPKWSGKINGYEISIADMDQAYIDMMMQWLYHPKSCKSCGDYIIEAHKRANDASKLGVPCLYRVSQ